MMQRAKLPEISTTRRASFSEMHATMLDDAMNKEYGNVQCIGRGIRGCM